MSIPTREQRPRYLYWEVEHAALHDVLTVYIPARIIRRDRTKLACVRVCEPDNAQEGSKWDVDPLFKNRVSLGLMCF